MKIIRWRAALLVLSAFAIAVGAGLAWFPLGLVVLGLEGFAAIYAVSYLEGRK